MTARKPARTRKTEKIATKVDTVAQPEDEGSLRVAGVADPVEEDECRIAGCQRDVHRDGLCDGHFASRRGDRVRVHVLLDGQEISRG